MKHIPGEHCQLSNYTLHEKKKPAQTRGGIKTNLKGRGGSMTSGGHLTGHSNPRGSKRLTGVKKYMTDSSEQEKKIARKGSGGRGDGSVSWQWKWRHGKVSRFLRIPQTHQCTQSASRGNAASRKSFLNRRNGKEGDHLVLMKGKERHGHPQGKGVPKLS